MTDAKELIELVRARYGSLENPNYLWTHGAFEAKPHEAVVGALRARFEVKDLTDPNDDVSTNLTIDIPGRAGWHLWLSPVLRRLEAGGQGGRRRAPAAARAAAPHDRDGGACSRRGDWLGRLRD